MRSGASVIFPACVAAPPVPALVVPVLLLESDSGPEDGCHYRRWELWELLFPKLPAVY